MAQHSVGFVYVLGNDEMPSLVKIGLSSLLPEDRAKKGFGTFVPVPYEVLFRAVTSRPMELERAVRDLSLRTETRRTASSSASPLKSLWIQS